MGTVDIDAAQASLLGGTLADLTTGKQVRVTGIITSSATGSILKAGEVKFISTSEDVKVEVLGTISDFVSSGSFRIRNSVINASGSAVEFSGGVASMLGNDVLVRIEGNLVGNQVVVSKLRFEDLDDDDTRYRAFVGTISSYAPSSGTFSIQGINAKLLAGTTFKASNGESATIGDVADGVAATVRGALVNNVFAVSEIEVSIANEPRLVKLRGGAYDVNISARTLKVNGQAVHWTSATRIDGSLSDLARGYILEAEGYNINNVVEAERLKVIKP